MLAVSHIGSCLGLGRKYVKDGIQQSPNLIELEGYMFIKIFKQASWFGISYLGLLLGILKAIRLMKSNDNLPLQEYLQAHFDALKKC